MCGQFKLDKNDADKLKNKFNLNLDIPSNDFKPTDKTLVLYKKDGEIIGELKHFGLNTSRSLIINARCETLLEKPTFKNVTRCIIPASNFYEWDHAKTKVSFYKDSILYLAGLFINDEYVIITTSANESIKRVHNRMPVIISEDRLGDWFDDTKYLDLLYKVQEPLKHSQQFEQLSLF